MFQTTFIQVNNEDEFLTQFYIKLGFPLFFFKGSFIQYNVYIENSYYFFGKKIVLNLLNHIEEYMLNYNHNTKYKSQLWS